MTNLKEYLHDGANHQAQAVMAFLRPMTIEDSWNNEYRRYDAEFKIARWENCREQGYVICLRSKSFEQLNIAFFEHRNSENICAIKWKEKTLNSPTIDTAKFGDQVYKDKWDVSHSVSYGQILEMTEWIKEQFEEFWEENKS